MTQRKVFVHCEKRLATVLDDRERKIYFPFISSEQNLPAVLCADTVQVLMGINIHSLTFLIIINSCIVFARHAVPSRITLNLMKCQLFLVPVCRK